MPVSPRQKKSAIKEQYSSGAVGDVLVPHGQKKRTIPQPQVAEGSQQLDTPCIESDGLIVIGHKPDIILRFRADEESTEVVRFKLDSESLVAKSKYFKHLLSDSRFSEGASVLRKSRPQNPDGDTAEDETPEIEIIELGRISPVKSIKPLLIDLFLSLHHGQISNRRMPLINLANLAITADRFDIAPIVADCARRANVILRPKMIKSPLDEDAVRQRLLIGLLWEDEELVRVHSRDLIIRRSRFWASQRSEPPNDALWFDLPRNVEGKPRN